LNRIKSPSCCSSSSPSEALVEIIQKATNNNIGVAFNCEEQPRQASSFNYKLRSCGGPWPVDRASCSPSEGHVSLGCSAAVRHGAGGIFVCQHTPAPTNQPSLSVLTLTLAFLIESLHLLLAPPSATHPPCDLEIGTARQGCRDQRQRTISAMEGP
jgi:hypothetical protein